MKRVTLLDSKHGFSEQSPRSYIPLLSFTLRPLRISRGTIPGLSQYSGIWIRDPGLPSVRGTRNKGKVEIQN